MKYLIVAGMLVCGGPGVAQAQAILECRSAGTSEPFFERYDAASSTREYFSRKEWAWKPYPCGALHDVLPRCTVTVSDSEYGWENKGSNRSEFAVISQNWTVRIDRSTGTYREKSRLSVEFIGAAPRLEERESTATCARAKTDPASLPRPAPRL